jgi:cobalt/nickel transport system ATP-binding protein
MNSPIIEVCDAHFSYLGKFPALCGVSLAIHQGEKVAVIGANGSGKSTLLHLLDGLFFADQGSVKIFGSELSETTFQDEEFSRNFRRRVGLVFQNPDIQLFCPTVKEDILFGPLQLGVAHAEIQKRLDWLAHMLDLEDLMNRAPYQLSVGEKRRVAIASVLSMDPDIILLDEPTAGLDPATTRHILDFLTQANKKGKTIVTSTHDLHIVEEISDRVYIFSRDKKIARCGTAAELLEDTEFLRENNLIHIHAHTHGNKVHSHPHRHLEHHV